MWREFDKIFAEILLPRGGYMCDGITAARALQGRSHLCKSFFKRRGVRCVLLRVAQPGHLVFGASIGSGHNYGRFRAAGDFSRGRERDRKGAAGTYQAAQGAVTAAATSTTPAPATAAATATTTPDPAAATETTTPDPAAATATTTPDPAAASATANCCKARRTVCCKFRRGSQPTAVGNGRLATPAQHHADASVTKPEGWNLPGQMEVPGNAQRRASTTMLSDVVVNLADGVSVQNHLKQGLFYIAGDIIYTKIFKNAGLITLVDVGILFLLYVYMHFVRGFSLVIMSPCLAKTGYGINIKTGIVLVCAGLRGAICLALGLIVELEEIFAHFTVKFLAQSLPSATGQSGHIGENGPGLLLPRPSS
eukprot:g931.t1